MFIAGERVIALTRGGRAFVRPDISEDDLRGETDTDQFSAVPVFSPSRNP
jgi:hypothetical protein